MYVNVIYLDMLSVCDIIVPCTSKLSPTATLPRHLLREGRREGKKVHKRTLANLTHWPKDKIERLRRVLKNEPWSIPTNSSSLNAPCLTATSRSSWKSCGSSSSHR